MKTLVVLAQKGGAGKTTLALHWAVEAEAKGKRRVVLVDVDPQGSAAAWFKRRRLDTPLLVQTSAGKLPEVLKACEADNVDYVIVDTAPHAEATAAECGTGGGCGCDPVPSVSPGSGGDWRYRGYSACCTTASFDNIECLSSEIAGD